jgi:inorganic pyrophosphatase
MFGFAKTLLALVPALALAQQYSLTEIGGRDTEVRLLVTILHDLTGLQDWRIHLKIDGKPASFWHDIPLYPDSGNSSIINFVVEIPRWQDAKIEIEPSEPLSMPSPQPISRQS